MCQFISFFHHSQTGEIKVSDLESHGNTEKALKLDPKGPFREGHYFPGGSVECRVQTGDPHTQQECDSILLAKFPRFVDFFAWALKETGQFKEYKGYLDLGSLTSGKDGNDTGPQDDPPQTVGGSLYLGRSVRQELKKREGAQ